MDNRYSQSSLAQFQTLHWLLQLVLALVLKRQDHTILEGHRSKERQLELYNSGASKLTWGKHNFNPSLAVDAGPWIPGTGFAWPDPNEPNYVKRLATFYFFAGYMRGVADELGIILRWGGDWDSDRDLTDQTFDDLVHFELSTNQPGRLRAWRLRRLWRREVQPILRGE